MSAFVNICWKEHLNAMPCKECVGDVERVIYIRNKG